MAHEPVAWAELAESCNSTVTVLYLDEDRDPVEKHKYEDGKIVALFPGEPVLPGETPPPSVVVTAKRLEALEAIASGVRQFLHPDNLIDADGLAERLAELGALEPKGETDDLAAT